MCRFPSSPAGGRRPRRRRPPSRPSRRRRAARPRAAGARGSARAPSTTSVRPSTRACPSDTFRKARTIAGSNCSPAHAASSRRAAGTLIGFLYERAAVITSKESATLTIRAANEIWSPSRPCGYPPPPNRSWCCSIAWPHAPSHGSSGSAMRAPIAGCAWSCSHSLASGRPGLFRIRAGTWILPMSCNSAAQRSRSRSWRREPQLARDEVRERPHPLAVSAGLPVMGRERGDEREDLLGSPNGLRIDAPIASLLDPHLQFADVARPAGHRETGGCPVGEHERESEQDREREEALPEVFRDRGGDRREHDEADAPWDQREAGRHRHDPDEAVRGGGPGRGGDEHRRGTQREAQQRPGPPASFGGLIGRVLARTEVCAGVVRPRLGHRVDIRAADVTFRRSIEAHAAPPTDYVDRSRVHARAPETAGGPEGRRRVVGRGRRTRAPPLQPQQGLLARGGLHEGRPPRVLLERRRPDRPASRTAARSR